MRCGNMAESICPISFRIPSQLLEKIDAVTEKQGFRSRSEMMLYAIRKYIEEITLENNRQGE